MRSRFFAPVSIAQAVHKLEIVDMGDAFYLEGMALCPIGSLDVTVKHSRICPPESASGSGRLSSCGRLFDCHVPKEDMFIQTRGGQRLAFSILMLDHVRGDVGWQPTTR